MRLFHRFGLLIAVNLAVFGLAFSVFSDVQAQERLTGVLSVIYGDNPDNPKILYQLNTLDGQIIPLEVPPEVMGAAGGITALMGAQVTVQVEGMVGTATGQTAPDTPLRVQALSIEQFQAEQATRTDGGITRSSTGAQTWLNLLCRFSGSASTPFTPAQVTGLFANSSPFLDHYWRESSFNQLTVSAVTSAAWLTLPRTRAQYLALPNYLNTLFDECVALHTGSFTFNDYAGFNLFFNSELDGYYWGSSCVSRTLQGVNKCWRNTWLPYYGITDLHAYAHEMGHAYGLPHSNNSDNDGYPYDNLYDVMSGFACAVYNATYGCLQSHTISGHKEALGWIPGGEIFTLASNGTFNITLDRLAKPTTTNYYYALVPISGSQEITIEARRNDFGDYDQALFNSGVVLHHINNGRSEPAWQMNAVSDGSSGEGPGVFEPGETYRDFVRGFSMTVNSETADGYDITLFKGTLNNPPDLAVSTFSTSVTPGKGTAMVRVQNNGSGTANAAYLAFDLPDGLYVNTITTETPCERVDIWFMNSYLCSLGNLAPAAQVDVPLDVRPSEAGTVQFTTTGVSNENETNAGNNNITVNMGSMTALPDLNVEVTSNALTAAINQNVIYTFVLRNFGGANASTVQLDAALPAGITLQGYWWSASGSVSSPACAVNGNGIRCTMSSLGPNYESNTHFEVNLSSRATSNGWKTITGTATLSGSDAMPADNADSVMTFVGTAATLTGHVNLQGRPTPPNAAHVTTVEVIITPSAGGDTLYDNTRTTNTSGDFTVTGLPPGDYDVWVKDDTTLSVVWTGTLNSGANAITIGTLKEGDANNDNTVTIADFSILASAFGTTSGGGGFDARADFNDDDTVTIADFSLLASNFGQVGQN